MKQSRRVKHDRSAASTSYVLWHPSPSSSSIRSAPPFSLNKTIFDAHWGVPRLNIRGCIGYAAVQNIQVHCMKKGGERKQNCTVIQGDKWSSRGRKEEEIDEIWTCTRSLHCTRFFVEDSGGRLTVRDTREAYSTDERTDRYDSRGQKEACECTVKEGNYSVFSAVCGVLFWKEHDAHATAIQIPFWPILFTVFESKRYLLEVHFKTEQKNRNFVMGFWIENVTQKLQSWA